LIGTEAPPRLHPEPVRLHGSGYLEVKDPCAVSIAQRCHLYGTGVTGPHRFEVLHASSDSPRGPWALHSPIRLPADLQGSCLAAPGVIAQGRCVHMFLQTDYNVLGGRVEHLLSHDGGATFTHCDTALLSDSHGAESGIYDAHPAEIGGRRYLSYSAFDVVGEPDIHLARSLGDSWDGPWERLGPILTHEDVPFHNARGTPGYEWGLEGAQLLELPDGSVLLNAVCFLAEGRSGSRQRVFTAHASSPEGPYTVLGTIFDPADGEHGHASVLLDKDDLVMFLQRRDGSGQPWRYATLRVAHETLRDAQARAAFG
jgi:hypothetical protein